MALSLLSKSFSKNSSILRNIQQKKNGLNFEAVNNQIRWSSHAPAKKDSHGHVESKDHGHGHDKPAAHGGHHAQPGFPNYPQEILDKYKKPPREHLFPFEEGDYIPPTETHSVGNEKLEIDFGPFDNTVLSVEFGTREKPVEVPSRYNFRIVGCTGSATVEHELLWHEVKEGKDLLCMECGQCFRHTRLPGFEHFGDDHGHHGHDEQPFSGHVDGDGYRFMYPPKTSAERAAEEAERAEELKKNPKAAAKKIPPHGVDYHQYGEHADEGKMAAASPIFQDKRPQIIKDRK